MKILGIDTTTRFLCLGIYDDSRIYEYNLEVGIKLSSLLGVTIKRVLNAARISINDIDYFACGLGPGSFTGVRVGIATIKGMSWVLNKPIIGISTLDILAKNAPDTDNLIVPAIDAKRNLIYCALYRKKNKHLSRISPYMLLNAKEFIARVKSSAVIFGDAVCLFKENFLTNIKEVTILDKDYWYPKAHNIIELTLERIKDKKFDNPFDIKPLYLYPKECQIRNKKSNG